MRSLIGRGWRLELIAALGAALAVPALAAPAGSSGLATQTTLSAEFHDIAGSTQATLRVTVTGQDGLPATGAVVLKDAGKPLAGVALDAQGHATSTLSLLPGQHSLTAVYAGDTTHQGSVSELSPVRAVTSSTPDFGITVAPAYAFAHRRPVRLRHCLHYTHQRRLAHRAHVCDSLVLWLA